MTPRCCFVYLIFFLSFRSNRIFDYDQKTETDLKLNYSFSTNIALTSAFRHNSLHCFSDSWFSFPAFEQSYTHSSASPPSNSLALWYENIVYNNPFAYFRRIKWVNPTEAVIYSRFSQTRWFANTEKPERMNCRKIGVMNSIIEISNVEYNDFGQSHIHKQSMNRIFRVASKDTIQKKRKEKEMVIRNAVEIILPDIGRRYRA